MPGFLLHEGEEATVFCSHAGEAKPTATNPRVLVDGHETVTIDTSYKITDGTCTLPPAASGPCKTAQFLSAATRLTSNGRPLLLQDSQSICAPSGTPLIILATQIRARGI